MSTDSLQASSTVNVATAKTETKAERPAQAEEISKIYVGPNIPKEGLNRFRVYTNGTTEHFKQLISDCPTVEKLFIDVEKLSTVLNQIEQTGSAYHTWYATVVKYVKGV